MKKLLIIPFLLIFTIVKSQVTFDSIYHELKRNKVKFPELFSVLVISESGFGTSDEDSFLISNNNFWGLGWTNTCHCKNKDGFASYKDLNHAIKDLKNQFSSIYKSVKSESQLVKYLCMYYIGSSSESLKGQLWIKRLKTISNDTFFE